MDIVIGLWLTIAKSGQGWLRSECLIRWCSYFSKKVESESSTDLLYRNSAHIASRLCANRGSNQTLKPDPRFII